MACLGKKKNETTKFIDSQLKKQSKFDLNQLKILLLGTGESGKSTIIKQMQIIYNNGFKNESDRVEYKALVFRNILRSTKVILDAMDFLKLAVEDKSLEEPMWELFEKDEDTYNELSTDDTELYRKLWADKGFQSVYSQRHEYQLSDSTAYFFGRLNEISKVDYIPNVDDILRARQATSGIHEFIFQVDKSKKIEFKMLDVGGQRSERRKWIHCFEQITAVIFIVASSEYDQELFETADTDKKVNRMVESIALFEQIIKYYWFNNTPFILFLNKVDLLKEKIQRSSIKKYFPNFKGDDKNLEQVTAFIKGLYIEVTPKSKPEGLAVHCTTAIDTDLIKVTMKEVNRILITNHLKDYNLMK